MRNDSTKHPLFVAGPAVQFQSGNHIKPVVSTCFLPCLTSEAEKKMHPKVLLLLLLLLITMKNDQYWILLKDAYHYCSSIMFV